MNLADRLSACRVLPVVTAHDVESTVSVAQALAAGGMSCVEITLRTAPAADSIRAVKAALPDLLIAAGTVTSADHVALALGAGADVCVSPGISRSLLETTAERQVPFLPGVATASEIMLGMSYGLELFKLFPAVAIGGINLLQSFGGPFPGVRFCPTGGLNEGNFQEFLSLPNVICCGGSWMLDDALVKSGSWSEIEARARDALAGSV